MHLRLPLPALRIASFVAGLVLVGQPAHARAPIAEDQRALEVARTAFDEGLEAYRDGDYARAVESWTSAHRLLLLAVDDTEMQRVLGFDLAQAHLQVYASDRDPKHLFVARSLLEDYILWIERPGHAITTAERPDIDRAHELLAIVEIDQAAAVADRHASPYPPGPPPASSLRRGRADVPPAPEPIRRQRREANAWIIGGGVGMALGVVFGATTGVLVGDGNSNGRSSAGVAAATSLTVIFSAAGITALTIGLVKRRALLKASPTLSKSSIGASVRLSF